MKEKVSDTNNYSIHKQQRGHLQLQTCTIFPGFTIQNVGRAKEENCSKYWDFFLSGNLYAKEVKSHSDGTYYKNYSYMDLLSGEAKCVTKRNIKSSKKVLPTMNGQTAVCSAGV